MSLDGFAGLSFQGMDVEFKTIHIYVYHSTVRDPMLIAVYPVHSKTREQKGYLEGNTSMQLFIVQRMKNT